MRDRDIRYPRTIPHREATLRIGLWSALPFAEQQDGSVIFTDHAIGEVVFLELVALGVGAMILVPTYQLLATLYHVGVNPLPLAIIAAALAAALIALLRSIARRRWASRRWHIHRDGRIEYTERTCRGEHTEKFARGRLAIHDTYIDRWRGWALFLHAGRRSFVIARFRRRRKVERYLHLLPPSAQRRYLGQGAYRSLTHLWTTG